MNTIYPKSLLDRDRVISVGDIVTIDDNSDEIETYFVTDVDENEINLCGLHLTAARDDTYLLSFSCPANTVLYLGDSFINYNGALWRARELYMKSLSIKKKGGE